MTEPAGPAVDVVPSGPAAPGRFDGATAILVRELRGRMRGKRAFIFLTVYLGFLATLLWLVLRTTEALSGISALMSIGIGRGIFAGVLLIETLVVVALAPAYTAGSISQEREKQTYDLLAVTPISSLSIVGGKLLSGLSYLALIVAASIPLACVAFVFGGIGPDDLFRGYLVIVVTGIGIGAIGTWCSAAMQRTQAATVATFIITGLMVAGASGLWIALDSREQDRGSNARAPEFLLWLNPFVAQMDVICQATGDGCVAQQATMERNPNFFGAAGPVQIDVQTGQPTGPAFNNGFVPQPIPTGGGFWPKSLLFYLALGVAGVLGASQSISPTRRWQWSIRRPSRPAPAVAAPEMPIEAPADD